MAGLQLGIVARQFGFDDPNTSSLYLDSNVVLLSAGSREDPIYRRIANVISKSFFYFHYPAYVGDLLFKTRIFPFHSYFNDDLVGLTHFMSYQIDLEALSHDVIAYAFSLIKGNYYVRPSEVRRSNYRVTSTNITLNVLDTNTTYVGGITTVAIGHGSSVSNPIEFITFKLRNIDLAFTTIFKL